MKRIKAAITGIAALGMTAILSTCSGYAHQRFQKDLPRVLTDTPSPKFDDYDVEIDDFGDYWSQAAADAVLKTVDDAATTQNVVVLLFVHGWHHNADSSDENRKDFRRTLERLDAVLDEPAYSNARETLGVPGPVKVIGIYLAWRGKSLPMPFDYLTFWGRKSTAETVGQRAAREFIQGLDRIYKARNLQTKTFMGLISVGHSFGAQVLLKSIDSTLATELRNRSSEPIQHPLENPVSGLGDVTVLVNPALEALQLDPIDRLYKGMDYPTTQTPVLLVFSGEKDWARQIFFPLGRHISALFKPSFADMKQRDMWLEALGEYEQQRTHKLVVKPGTQTTFPSDYCALARTFDLSAMPPLHEASLEPISGRERPFSPIVVAYSSNELVESHNGIFKEGFRGFLIDYVALIEGKRLCLTRGPDSPRGATKGNSP